MKAVVTLKSGARVKACVSEIHTKRSNLTGELVEMTWKPKGKRNRLLSVDIREVATVVVSHRWWSR